jgi:hypothetical protein
MNLIETPPIFKYKGVFLFLFCLTISQQAVHTRANGRCAPRMISRDPIRTFALETKISALRDPTPIENLADSKSHLSSHLVPGIFAECHMIERDGTAFQRSTKAVSACKQKKHAIQ